MSPPMQDADVATQSLSPLIPIRIPRYICMYVQYILYYITSFTPVATMIDKDTAAPYFSTFHATNIYWCCSCFLLLRILSTVSSNFSLLLICGTSINNNKVHIKKYELCRRPARGWPWSTCKPGWSSATPHLGHMGLMHEVGLYQMCMYGAVQSKILETRTKNRLGARKDKKNK